MGSDKDGTGYSPKIRKNMIPPKPNMGKYSRNDSGYALIRVLEKQVAQLKRKIVDWEESEKEMPEHNKSCLVFIPEEDNHITAGMWDISEKWILLDDYREPKSIVTHWAYMPDGPNSFIKVSKK